MQKYLGVVNNPSGAVVPYAFVTVVVYGTGAAATLYSDNGVTLLPSNTVTADSQGEFYFYAANGRYSYTITAPNYVSETYTDFILFDPASAGAVAASSISFTPSGTLSSTNVQTAITEVTTDLYAVSSPIERIKRTILNTPTTYPGIASYSGLSVTRNTANNPTPNSASITLVSGSYTGPVQMIKAGRLWSRFSAGLDKYSAGVNGAILLSKPSADLSGNGSGFAYYSPPLHFIHDGRYFEYLGGSANQSMTLLVNDQFAFTGPITKTMTNGVEGATNLADGQQNCWLKIDFGSRATRKISLYSATPWMMNFALADAKDSVQGWDRTGDPWAMVMCDSFGQSTTQYWISNGGLYREALHRLGIFDVLVNAYGGAGYQPTAAQPLEANSGRYRINDMALFQNPDLTMIALGVNDNVNSADAVYPTAGAALASFTTSVASTLAQARLNGTKSLLVVLAPWITIQGNANFSNSAQGAAWKLKSDIIFNALQNISGPWVYVDPFTDYVTTSNDYKYGPFGAYSAVASAGPNPSGANWWTGTGTTAAPAGNGNGDLYTDDNTHPNVAGGTYLGTRLAMVLRQAIFSFPQMPN